MTGPTEIVAAAANRILPGPKVTGSLAEARAAYFVGAVAGRGSSSRH